MITLAVGGIGWTVALGAPPASVQPGPELAARSAPIARARAGDAAPRATVTVEIDGLQVAAAGTTEQTVRELLSGLGVHLLPTDRLSVDPAQRLVPGMRLALDRGVPVTLVDGGQREAGRAPRGTVAALLSARGIVLSPLDKMDVAQSAEVAPGTVVTITRVADREITEAGTVAFPVQTIADPDLETGRFVVESQGTPGEALRSYVVRYVDGVEASRALVAEVEVRAPVTEIRRVGMRPRTVPPPPAEIERIIREAAERWGADPVQLMRVAYCESRYNPNAYNPTASDSGLFQFIPETWRRQSPLAGYAGASPFDPVAAANTAARMFSRGQAGQWTCK